MGLKRFDYKLPGQRKNFKQIAIVLCICLIAVLSFTSYALYEVRHPNDFVNSKVGEFNTSDMSLTVLIDGIKSDTFPAKDSGKVFEKLECTNGGSASWNSDTWKLTINDITGPTECTVNFITKIDQFGTDSSNAAVPVLNNGLIPVIYENNEWVKADITEPWYNYDKQLWANAVTVTSSSRSTYTSASAGTPISMDDIETMWVWIPRYEYQHTNLSTKYAGETKELPGAITINFISKDTFTPSSSNFTVHDAFWWDNNNNGTKDTGEQLSGIWVAKFEMSTDITCTASSYSSIGSGCNMYTINPKVKPNVTSWRGAQIGTFWYTVYSKMGVNQNMYGLNYQNTIAHLMKNIEWGAVAYLSQSKFGKYGNPNYIGEYKEIAVNNCSNYITGIGGDDVNASKSETTCTTNTYETEKGQAASTTGNIYGIYDMSGGASEYVMGIQAIKDSNPPEPSVGVDIWNNSGWTGKLDDGTSYTGTYSQITSYGSRYYDLYDYSEYVSGDIGASRYHKGDATYETANWYSDGAYFLSSPFFTRGYSGIFEFSNAYGKQSISTSGRPTLVPLN